jgi:hypothetical protein
MARYIVKASVLAASLMLAQQTDARPVNDKHWSLLANRLFPTLEALEKVGGQSPTLAGLLNDRRTRLAACQHAAPCVLTASLWTDQEIDGVATYADHILGPQKGLSADDSVKARTERELQGINTILKVYGLGATPEYPTIDGPIETPGTAPFNVMVADAVLYGEAGADDPSTSLDPSIATALALLDVNNHNDAVAYEPLNETFNGPAAALAKTTDWSHYKYTAIIVPGKGPDDAATPFSERGKLRIRLAAEQFADGVAPFIIVSGASVHPKGTKYVEAIEMRKALIAWYGIPADRIIVEPYARHTTTNLRNAARLLITFGAPLDRDTLIVTDADQNDYIQNPNFKALNDQHLGYQPGIVGIRLSPTELTYRPSAQSQRLNPADPLDP